LLLKSHILYYCTTVVDRTRQKHSTISARFLLGPSEQSFLLTIVTILTPPFFIRLRPKIRTTPGQVCRRVVEWYRVVLSSMETVLFTYGYIGELDFVVPKTVTVVGFRILIMGSVKNGGLWDDFDLCT